MAGTADRRIELDGDGLLTELLTEPPAPAGT